MDQPIFLNTKLQAEYDRAISQVGDDPYANYGLGVHDVVKVHFALADHFMTLNEGLGGIGIRSANLLHSALSRQAVEFEGVRKWSKPHEIAATLLYGITKNHAFHDANKRTAFLSVLYFLKIRGYIPAVNIMEFEDITVYTAENELRKFSRYRDLVGQRNPDPEVCFLARWLEHKTRRPDKRDYDVTFHELNRILKRFDCELVNPDRNFIDLIKYENRDTLFGFGKPKRVSRRIFRTGFPGWKNHVGKERIKEIRKAAKLCPEDGIDSQVFFKDADPLDALIYKYRSPLLNLAYR